MVRQEILLPIDRVIAFHPLLARVLGGVEEAIYFQQLYFWSDKGKRADGYIYKTKEEIENETYLSRYQQDRVRRKLIKEGYIEVKLIKANGSPTIHYKIDAKTVQKAIDSNQFPNSKKLTNPLVRNSLMESLETYDSITESTTEKTTKNNNNENGEMNFSRTLGLIRDNTERFPYIETIIARYLRAYKSHLREEHPKLKVTQYRKALESLGEFHYEHMESADNEHMNDNWDILIDYWFTSRGVGKTDYNINHFANISLLTNMYYEKLH